MQARLRAQLGDRSKYSGERRRRSVVEASIVLAITDPLRGSYPFWYYLQAALIRSCGASFACMELTMISRFQRLQASTKSLFHSLFYSFSVLSPSACFQCVDRLVVSFTLYLKTQSFPHRFSDWFSDWGGSDKCRNIWQLRNFILILHRFS